MLNTVVNPMLNTLGGGGKKGNQLIQLGGSFNSLAGTAVIILSGIMIPSVAKAQISDVFPLMYAALGIFAFAFLVLSISRIPETTDDNKAQASNKESSKIGPMSFRHFVLGAVAIFVYVGVEVGIPNVLQKWLQNGSLNVLNVSEGAEAIAGSVAATYWFLMLIGRLVGAAVGAKVSAKAMLTTVSAIGIALVLGAILSSTETMVNMPVFKNSAEGLFGFVNVPINAMLLVLVGLCTSVMWGGIFNLAVEGLGKYTEKASGIFMALVCGGGVLPLLQNAIVDMQGGVGYQASYWVVVVGLAYLLFYALIGSKPSKQPVE
jgi:FHS family L-fucose permease-like MFS transporter